MAPVSEVRQLIVDHETLLLEEKTRTELLAATKKKLRDKAHELFKACDFVLGTVLRHNDDRDFVGEITFISNENHFQVPAFVVVTRYKKDSYQIEQSASTYAYRVVRKGILSKSAGELYERRIFVTSLVDWTILRPA